MKMKMKMKKRSLGTVALVGLLVGSLWSVPAASAGATTGKVTVVHAVPGLTVDVYANDALFLEDFVPGTIEGPVDLPADTYDIDITPANDPTVVLSASAMLQAGDDVTIAAHLTAAGDPTLSLFKNKMYKRAGKAKVTVRHLAAAPEVDVRTKKPGNRSWKAIVQDLSNGSQATYKTRPGRRSFDVTLADTSTRVLGPVTTTLKSKKHLFVYAWGSANDGTLDLMSQMRH